MQEQGRVCFKDFKSNYSLFQSFWGTEDRLTPGFHFQLFIVYGSKLRTLISTRFLNFSITDILWGFVEGECPCALYDIEHHPRPQPTRSQQHHPTWDDQRCRHTFFPGEEPSHSWLRTAALSPALVQEVFWNMVTKLVCSFVTLEYLNFKIPAGSINTLNLYCF